MMNRSLFPGLVVLAFASSVAACSSAPESVSSSSQGMIAVEATEHVAGSDAGTYCEEPGRFVVRGGAVLDQANDAGRIEWQRFVSPDSYTQPEATAYCASLCLDGGGWRLPTVTELASLVLHPIGLGASHEPTCEPSIDQVAFPSTPPDDFWTSTTRPGLDEAMYTGFDDGRSHPAALDTPMSVRCVR
jgi:hypothetical protein